MNGLEAIAAASALDLLALSPPGWGATLLRGLWNSVLIATGAYALGLLIGIGGAYGKLYGSPIVKDLLAVYTTLVRAVPELVLILILYYAVTDAVNQLLISFGYARIQLSGLAAGIAVLGVVQGAYATEVLRGAILSVPAGQIEAARAMGINHAPRLAATVPADNTPPGFRHALERVYHFTDGAQINVFPSVPSPVGPGRVCGAITRSASLA